MLITFKNINTNETIEKDIDIDVVDNGSESRLFLITYIFNKVMPKINNKNDLILYNIDNNILKYNIIDIKDIIDNQWLSYAIQFNIIADYTISMMKE